MKAWLECLSGELATKRRDSSFKSLPEKEQREKVGAVGRWESVKVWWCFYPVGKIVGHLYADESHAVPREKKEQGVGHPGMYCA